MNELWLFYFATYIGAWAGGYFLGIKLLMFRKASEAI